MANNIPSEKIHPIEEMSNNDLLDWMIWSNEEIKEYQKFMSKILKELEKRYAKKCS